MIIWIFKIKNNLYLNLTNIKIRKLFFKLNIL